MIVSIAQIRTGLIRFIEQEVAAKAVDFDKFKVNFILPRLPKLIDKVFVQYQDNVLFKDYFDENGNVNIDELYNDAKEASKKTGKFNFAGLIFAESDFNKMYEYIKNVG